MHLFDDGPEGAVGREESTVERWERAGLLFGEKRYAAAARLLVEVVEEFPEHTAARMLLARAYYHSAQLGRAEAELRLVIERDPVDAYAHLMLGRTLERQSRKEEAEPWLRMAGAFAAE
ncbi:tetratricopeptide repeat protein [Streptomyces sp. LHD-70]|nr:tetratricopeptide repeat protein [Streptomyces sp. LHD-70]MDQ8703943.1 tetratricopeptide repeat protein [Streptomyces sp. LHD-70]